MKKLKKILKYILLYLAHLLLIIDLYTAAYYRVRGERSTRPVLLAVACMMTFCMGVMVLLAGLLTEKEERTLKQRRVMIWLGLILAIASAVGFYLVLPTLPA